MPKQSKATLRPQYKNAATKKAFFTILGFYENAPEEGGGWFVLYGISADKKDLDGASAITHRKLKKLFAPYFKNEIEPPHFEDECSHNLYAARVGSKERAERLASELVYIFVKAGMIPMTDDKKTFKPKVPQP